MDQDKIQIQTIDKSSESILQKCSHITYTVDDAETSIALLSSKESDIVSKTLSNLCKNIEIDEKLLDFLITNGLFIKVADLLKNQLDLLILKYVLKLYGLMVREPSSIEKLDKKTLYDSLPRLLRFYFFNPDDFVKEACSLILVKVISFNPVLSVYICFDKIMRSIIKILRTSIDPDVLKNSLELFRYMMNCENFLEQLNHFKRKHMNVFICLLYCGVDAISDIAIDILHRISALKIDKVSRKMAKGETLSKMVSIITNKNKRYSDKAIEIIDNCIRNEQAAVYFSHKDDFINLLQFLKDCDNNSLIKVLPIFSIMSKIPSIRKKIFIESGEDILFQFLKYRHEIIVLNMCQIIANFTMHKDCCNKILTPQVMKYLVEIFINFPTEYKINALKAIHSFVKYEPSSLRYLSHTGALNEVQEIFLGDENIPLIYEMATEIISAVVWSPYKKKLDIPKLCEKIMGLLRTNYTNIKTILKIVYMLVQEQSFRKQFVASSGPEYFISIIQRNSFSDIYQLSLDIIQNLLKYEDVAFHFLNLGLMSLMNSMIKKGTQKADIYKDIVNGLCDWCLTVKFFDKKFLSGEDVIDSLFFLFQEYTLSKDNSEFNPIYIVNISSNIENKSLDESLSLTTTQESAIIKTLNNHSAGMRAALSHSCGYYSFEEDFLPKDEYLEQYFQELSIELLRSELSLTEKVEKVALFVEKQLSGILFTDSEEEKHLHFQRHINEICMNLGHRFIPIGYLRMGYFCEKALLFKVLGDNLGVPSGLHHESSGLFWNSVSKGMSESDIFIVDFKDKIGSLIQVDSEPGRKYLGL